jgi:hypothetical protein
MSLYNPNVPTGTIALNQDYNNIRNNFNQLNITYTKDHIPFDNTTSQNGYHKVVHMVPSVGTPAAVAGIGELYCRTVSGQEQLFFQTGPGLVIQMTNGFVPVLANNGYTFLPGGIIFQWGYETAPAGAGPHTLTFPISFPSKFYNIQCTMRANSTSTNVIYPITIPQVVATPSITYTNTSSSIREFYWTAIGQ